MAFSGALYKSFALKSDGRYASGVFTENARVSVAASKSARYEPRRRGYSEERAPCCTREECTQERLRRVDLPGPERPSPTVDAVSPETFAAL